MAALGTLEERIDRMLEDKQRLSDSIVSQDESWLTELDRDPFLLFQLRGMGKSGLQKALADSPLGEALRTQFSEPDKLPPEYVEYRYTRPAREAKNDLTAPPPTAP